MPTIERISPEECKTTTWSGGKTTELALFPSTGDYQERRFSYRLSTATVAKEESRFTPLPGFRRLLMTLDFSIILQNQTLQEVVSLKLFEVYCFDGSDAIISQGKCRDFNVMYDSMYQAELEVVLNGQFLKKTADIHFIYALVDSQFQLSESESRILEAKHLLKIVPESRSERLNLRFIAQTSVQTEIALWIGLRHTNFVSKNKI